jgi:hypothetical protein
VKGVLSIEGKEIVVNISWMKMDLKFYFFKRSVGIQKKLENKFCCIAFLVFELFGDCNLFWISPRTCSCQFLLEPVWDMSLGS